MNSLLTTTEPSAVVHVDRLADWSGMARHAFAANTLRAWRADWESRGATEDILRDAVNPSLEAVEKTSCFLHPGEHPQSLHSTYRRDDL
jgi:hypothetical protein